jgi:uncharacterized protein YpbB
MVVSPFGVVKHLQETVNKRSNEFANRAQLRNRGVTLRIIMKCLRFVQMFIFEASLNKNGRITYNLRQIQVKQKLVSWAQPFFFAKLLTNKVN